MIAKIKQKYNKVEYIQFNRGNYNDCNNFTNNKLNKLTIERRVNGKCYCYLFNNNEVKIVYEDDYIIKFSENDIEIVKKTEFESKYIKED